MQSKLMSDDFNIETIAVVLLYEMRLDDGTYATLDLLKDSIKEYNGSQKYADYVVQYLYDMRRYLSYD